MAPPGPRGREAQGIILAGSVFCFAFLLALFPLQSYDVWWHMANGREIAQGRGIPRTNLYSFTHPEVRVTPTHWLFGLGAYCVHAAFGVDGLVVAKALLVGAAFTIAFLLARRRGAGAAASAAVVALAVLASRRRFLERPHLFTMLGLAGFAYLLERFRELSEREGDAPAASGTGGLPARAWRFLAARENRPALVLAPLAALWANLHAGCLFGVGLVGIAAAGDLVSWLARRSRLGADAPATRRAGLRAAVLAATTLACAVAVMAAPAGWYVYAYNLWHVGLAEVVPLNEFRAATPRGQPVFCLLVLLGGGAMALARPAPRPADVIAFVVFAALGAYAVRGIPNFVLVAAPPVAAALARAWERARADVRLARVAAALDRVPAQAASMALVVLPFAGHFASPRCAIGLGVERGLVPEEAAEFVEREIAADRPVFNDFAAGGYLAWRWYPGRRVFVDGRTNAYPRDLLGTLYARAVERETVERIFDWYGVNNAILLDYGDGNPFWPVFDLDEWAVVHADETALVLSRRIPANRAMIERHEGRLGARAEAVLSMRLDERGRGDAERAVRARARGLGADAERLAARGRKSAVAAAAAAERALKAESVGGARVFADRERASLRFRMGVGAELIGDPAAAAEMYAKALETRPDFAEARLNLGHVLLGLGRPAEARAEYEKALELSPGRPEALFGLGRALEALGLADDAAAAYRRFVETGAGAPRDVEKARAFLGSPAPSPRD